LEIRYRSHRTKHDCKGNKDRGKEQTESKGGTKLNYGYKNIGSMEQNMTSTKEQIISKCGTKL
jgi:hypothetical protein